MYMSHHSSSVHENRILSANVNEIVRKEASESDTGKVEDDGDEKNKKIQMWKDGTDKMINESREEKRREEMKSSRDGRPGRSS